MWNLTLLWRLMYNLYNIYIFTASLHCRCRLGEGGDATLVRHEGRGSEGFLEHVFKHAANELFGVDVHEITYKSLRLETPGLCCCRNTVSSLEVKSPASPSLLLLHPDLQVIILLVS